ncbi:hypothetical protein C7M84_011336 [Penaeus vannamei]|uniref:Apple domain-containing protein n=1 Tax=Penaeus vannamei TaxID=6689 RepID=A0A423T1M2_PENVA|nr:hypothetical protein C7M84_011336 [Penaeus vannamei]
MTVFGFVVVFFVALTLASQQITWLRAGSDVKFVRSGTVLEVKSVARIQCGVACCILEDCLAFNYHGPTSECQLLSAAPASLAAPDVVASPDWAFYVVNVPSWVSPDAGHGLSQRGVRCGNIAGKSSWEQNRDPCSASGCPVTTMCLGYDQPVQLIPYNSSLPEFICSDNVYYLRRRKAGLAGCRLEVIYGFDLYGFDTAYLGVSAPYHEALQECMTYNCVSMACHGTEDGLRQGLFEGQGRRANVQSECGHRHERFGCVTFSSRLMMVLSQRPTLSARNPTNAPLISPLPSFSPPSCSYSALPSASPFCPSNRSTPRPSHILLPAFALPSRPPPQPHRLLLISPARGLPPFCLHALTPPLSNYPSHPTPPPLRPIPYRPPFSYPCLPIPLVALCPHPYRACASSQYPLPFPLPFSLTPKPSASSHMPLPSPSPPPFSPARPPTPPPLISLSPYPPLSPPLLISLSPSPRPTPTPCLPLISLSLPSPFFLHPPPASSSYHPPLPYPSPFSSTPTPAPSHIPLPYPSTPPTRIGAAELGVVGFRRSSVAADTGQRQAFAVRRQVLCLPRDIYAGVRTPKIASESESQGSRSYITGKCQLPEPFGVPRSFSVEMEAARRIFDGAENVYFWHLGVHPADRHPHPPAPCNGAERHLTPAATPSLLACWSRLQRARVSCLAGAAGGAEAPLGGTGRGGGRRQRGLAGALGGCAGVVLVGVQVGGHGGCEPRHHAPRGRVWAWARQVRGRASCYSAIT